MKSVISALALLSFVGVAAVPAAAYAADAKLTHVAAKKGTAHKKHATKTSHTKSKKKAAKPKQS